MSKGDPVAGGKVFLSGIEDPLKIETAADGNFEFEHTFTADELTASSGTLNLSMFAWKQDGDNKLGTLIQGIQVNSNTTTKNLGKVAIIWTHAGHFSWPEDMKIPKGTAMAVTIKEAPFVKTVPTWENNYKFDLTYLPTGVSYTIQIKAEGYQDFEEKVMWPATEIANAWFSHTLTAMKRNVIE